MKKEVGYILNLIKFFYFVFLYLKSKSNENTNMYCVIYCVVYGSIPQ